MGYTVNYPVADFYQLPGAAPPTAPLPPMLVPPSPAALPTDKNDFRWGRPRRHPVAERHGTPGIWLVEGFSRLAGANVGGFNPGSGWKVEDAGDFSGDGHADILWQNVNGAVGIWDAASTYRQLNVRRQIARTRYTPFGRRASKMY